MTGGTITGNSANVGGGVNTNGTFTMEGGTITGNTATTQGNGVNVATSGTFNLKTGSNATIIGEIYLSTAEKNIILLADSAMNGSYTVNAPFHAATNVLVDGTTVSAAGLLGSFTFTFGTGANLEAAVSDKNIIAQTATAVYVRSNTDTSGGTASVAGNDTTGNGSFAKPYATLAKAYINVPDGGKICVLSDLTVTTATITFGVAKAVTIQSYSSENTVRGDAANGGDGNEPWKIKRGSINIHLFTLTAGSVTLRNITIDGGAVWKDAKTPYQLGHDGAASTAFNTGLVSTIPGGKLFHITSATLTLDTGATLQNNDINSTTNADSGSAVGMFGTAESRGTLNIKPGSKIINNAVRGLYADGAAICARDSYSDINMSGGEITGNYSQRWAAIRVQGTSVLYLSGGKIMNNYAGGVGQNNNIATYGAGVALTNGGCIVVTNGRSGCCG